MSQPSTIVVATSQADADAVPAIEAHHAELTGGVAARTRVLVDAATRGTAWEEARGDLVAFATDAVLPHATAEEKVLYQAARAQARGALLIDALVAEHGVLRSLVEELSEATQPVAAAATARAFEVLFASHVSEENEIVLPLLAAAPDVALGELVARMHEEFAHEAPAAESEGGCGGSCSCGETDAEGLPELDARSVPHAIRHATIFGALDAVRPGGGMVLVAPHDPLPLLAQLEARAPGVFEVSYLERGPEAWRIAFLRTA
jgi:uncharacterized protein (DUF2249 family)